MTEAEIRSKIRCEENELKKLKNERTSLIKEKNKYRDLKDKFIKLKSDFTAKQRVRKQGLGKFAATANLLKSAQKYYLNMNSLLNGKQYINAVSGIETAITKAKKKIENLNGEIKNHDGKIKTKENKISNLKEQLKIAIAEAQTEAKATEEKSN